MVVLRSHFAGCYLVPMGTTMSAVSVPARDVRLALVLNGGVSLAIWIGGVTHEIDASRRGLPPGGSDDGHDTAPLYDRLNAILGQRVVVDVIGGASAGGINGVMLGAAIYTGAALPNLREVWIELGDFRKLLRSATTSSPPSLLRGDDSSCPSSPARCGRCSTRPVPRRATRSICFSRD